MYLHQSAFALHSRQKKEKATFRALKRLCCTILQNFQHNTRVFQPKGPIHIHLAICERISNSRTIRLPILPNCKPSGVNQRTFIIKNVHLLAVESFKRNLLCHPRTVPNCFLNLPDANFSRWCGTNTRKRVRLSLLWWSKCDHCVVGWAICPPQRP